MLSLQKALLRLAFFHIKRTNKWLTMVHTLCLIMSSSEKNNNKKRKLVHQTMQLLSTTESAVSKSVV